MASKKKEVVDVTLYKVSPKWGYKNLKIIGVRCLRRGKTLFIASGGIGRWGIRSDLFDTPQEAIDARVAALDKEGVDDAKYIKERDSNRAALIDLKKKYVG